MQKKIRNGVTAADVKMDIRSKWTVDDDKKVLEDGYENIYK